MVVLLGDTTPEIDNFVYACAVHCLAFARMIPSVVEIDILPYLIEYVPEDIEFVDAMVARAPLISIKRRDGILGDVEAKIPIKTASWYIEITEFYIFNTLVALYPDNIDFRSRYVMAKMARN